MCLIKIAETCRRKFHSVEGVEGLVARNYTPCPAQRRTRLVLACLLVALCQGVPAASYFVAKTGSDRNPGTADQPFLTVKRGVDLAAMGDAVFIGPGTYSEDITSARSGAKSAMITIDGQGVAQVDSFLLNHGFLHLNNLTVAGRNKRFLLYMDRNADNCVISNNILDAGYTAGMTLMSWNGPDAQPFGNAGSHNLIISNTFKRARGGTVIGSFGDRNVFMGNRLIDGDAVDWFRVFGRSNSIVANVCSNAFDSGTSENHPDFFQAFGNQGYGSRANIIERNIVIGMDGASQLCMFEGQDCEDIQDFTFRNNLFVGVSAKGTMACRNVKWYNNVFYQCSTNSLTSGPVLIFTTATNTTYTNVVVNSGHGGEVFNNVFLDCGGTNTDRGWYGFDTGLTNVQADYNFVGKNNSQAVVVDSLQRAVGDPHGWNKFAWWEPHGINGGNPLFANKGKLDFRLEAGSPLIGAALPLNQLFTTDMRGRTRGAQWDIGALEFQAGETVLGPRAPTNVTARVLSP